MRGLVLAIAEIDKVEHIGRETESVAELLDEHTQVYGEQRVGGPIAEIDECKTCQGHAPRHGPQPLFQAAARSHDAAHDAAYGKTDYAYGAVDESHLACAQAETAFVYGVEQEGVDELYKLGFRQAVEEHESHCHPYLLFGEEAAECLEKFAEYLAGRAFASMLAAVGRRTGKRPAVVHCHGKEESRKSYKHHQPRHRDVAARALEPGAHRLFDFVVYVVIKPCRLVPVVLVKHKAVALEQAYACVAGRMAHIHPHLLAGRRTRTQTHTPDSEIIDCPGRCSFAFFAESLCHPASERTGFP